MMRKISKSAMAAGLAAATVVSGLSFGPAAMAAPSTKSAVTADDDQIQLIFQERANVYYSLAGPYSSQKYYKASTSLEDAKKVAMRFTPALQPDGSYRLTAGSSCAGILPGYVNGISILAPGYACSTFHFNNDGTVSVNNANGYNQVGMIGSAQNGTLEHFGLTVGLSAGFQYKGEVPGEKVENGGFDAKGVGTAATIAAGTTESVRFGAKITRRVTSMTGTTTTVTAPAGTTFAAGTTQLVGEYLDADANAWKPSNSLKLTGTVSANGRTFTGTMANTGSGFALNTGNTARWVAPITAPTNALESKGDLDFTVKGSTNAGAFEFSGQSPITVTASNGGLDADGIGHPESIQPNQTKAVRFGAKATGRINQMSGTEITVTAPSGSTFTPGQTKLDTYYRATDGDEWSRSLYHRISGEVSADGTTFTGTSNGSGFTFHPGTELRWGINVIGGNNAGTNNLAFTLAGNSNAGTFRVQGTSAVTISAAALSVKVDSQDDAARTAQVSGTATKGAEIFHGTTKIATADTNGAWSGELTDLQVGSNTITLTQKIGGKDHDTKSVTVTVTDRLIGANGPDTVLNRGTDTTVHAHVKTNTQYKITDGKVEFTAPAGTTFATGQDTITGQHKAGGAWRDSANVNLTDGKRSADGKTYTYTWVNTGPMSDATEIRWGIKVATPKNGPAINSTMAYAVSGTSTTGTFTATGTTKTTAAEHDMVELTADHKFDADPTKLATIFGAAEAGATVTLYDAANKVIATTTAGSDNQYSFDVPAPKTDGKHTFQVSQTVAGKPESTKVPVTLDYGQNAALKVTAPAIGARVDAPRPTFTGTGQTDAHIEVNGTKRTIGSGSVTDGAWTFPADFDLSLGTYKVTAVQTTKGGVQTSAPVEFTVVKPDDTVKLTAKAAFDAVDENLPATISGDAQLDATVTVKDTNGQVIGTAKATGGKYSIVIPPKNATFGVNTFTITQTAFGKESEPISRDLDYGNPVEPTITSPAQNATVPAGKVTFTGTGSSGAKVSINGTVSTIGSGPVTDGTWTATTRELTPNLYRLTALQTSKGGLTKGVERLIRVEKQQITELTATGSFPDAVDQNAFISGNAHTGATVVVREGRTVIASATARNSRYSIEIPAGAAGVRAFTVTQNVNGQESAPKPASLDYGTVTPVTVESPTQGERVTGGTVTFTGTGTPGGMVSVNGTVSQLGSIKVDDNGNWSLTLNRTLTPQAYTLSTKQTTKGNMTGTPVTRTFTVTK